MTRRSLDPAPSAGAGYPGPTSHGPGPCAGTSGREEREAKARLMSVLFNAEVPDPRNTLLLGLAHSTGALASVLTEEELEKASDRINEVVGLEEIGRSVSLVASQVWGAMSTLMMSYTH